MLEFNKIYKGKTLDNVWLQAYNDLTPTENEMIHVASSRDGDVVGEIINATLIVEDPTRNILKSSIRNMPMRYAVGEFLWYLSGNPSLQAIGHYSKAWERMSDDGRSVNSNYGFIIGGSIDRCHGESESAVDRKSHFNQFDYCYDLLREDPNTRQAVIHIKSPRDTRKYPTKDLNCTVYCQFFIRDDKLYMSTHMRSNDLWMGVPYDCFFFMNLQVLMAMKLGIDIGTYTHYAGSLHLYMRDYEASLQNMKKVQDEVGNPKESTD